MMRRLPRLGLLLAEPLSRLVAEVLQPALGDGRADGPFSPVSAAYSSMVLPRRSRSSRDPIAGALDEGVKLLDAALERKHLLDDSGLPTR
jgi:hypothetical protein